MRRISAGRLSSRARAGFTLIELLLVMVILSVLAAVVVPKFINRGLEARITAARVDITTLGGCLDTMQLDTGRYPRTDEGLGALVNQPADVDNWHGSYISPARVPVDPWKHPYNYKYPGEHNTGGFDLYSLGPDGQEGGGDDIDNWSE